jgi:hypothetical protein
VFYLPDAAARERMQVKLAAAVPARLPRSITGRPTAGVTYQDPDGREGVFASWIYRPLAS